MGGRKSHRDQGRGIMQLAIQASVALSVIGAVIISILLYYHRQTATVWVTFTTIVFVALSFCLYWQAGISRSQETQSNSFTVQVRSALVSDAGPLTMYMVAYPSMFGETTSPVLYLTYVQITNLQDIASTISEFSVSASKNPNGPWESLVPIPLTSTSLFALGIRTPSPKNLAMGHGTYRLATPMKTTDMKYAAVLQATPTLESELTKLIQPHGAISGWVAFDSETHKGLTPGQIYFRVNLRDTAKKGDAYVVPLPLKKGIDSSMEIANGHLLVTGQVVDISRFKVRYYSEPYPRPEARKEPN